MKKKFFDLCRMVWVWLASSFNEYSEMKKQQVARIVEADEAGDHDKVATIVENL